MDLENKLIQIDKSVHELKQTQQQILQKLVLDNWRNGSDNTVKQFEMLESHVHQLESQFGQHYSALKEVTKLVLTLLDKVHHLHVITDQLKVKGTVSPCQKITVSVEKTTLESDQTDLLRKQNKTSLFSSKHVDLVNNTSHVIGIPTKKSIDTLVPHSTNSNVNEKEVRNSGTGDECMTFSECHLETESPLDNAGVKYNDNRYSGLLSTEQDSQLPSGNTNDVKTKNVTVKDSGTEFNDVCKKRLLKNEFGFKQKGPSLESDNRVSFHSSLQCFEGQLTLTNVEIPVEQLPSPNIRPKVNKGSQSFGFEDTLHALDSNTSFPNSNINSQLRSLKEWSDYADQVREHASVRIMSGAVQRGRHGHDVILVLDTSGRMKGHKFEAIRSAAIQFVDGIKQVYRETGLEDNIGLAEFGCQTRLIHESTSNYDLLIQLIGQLKPEGEAPLLGGLLMGLAGVNGGATSQIMEIEVPGHMIIFTDGTSAQVSSVFESNPSYFTRDFRGHAESGSVITLIAGQAVKIFYVPIGENTSNATLEFAVAETGGKIIPATEIYRLIRITQVMLLAARVASAIRFAAHNQNRDVIRRKIAETERTNVENVHDDSVDMVLEFVNPLTSQMRRGMYRELNYRTLKLGDRVRRGSYWPYGDQDTGLPGTVVGQNGGGSIWVEWDNSHINHYVYNEEVGVYSLRKVNEKRILFGEMIGVGCRVIRGIDWKFDNYDGGVGSLGTVLCVRKEGTVVVRWDCKSIGLYKIGCNNLFEVQVYDNTDSDTNYLVHNELFTSQTNQPKQWKETDQSFECPSDIQYTKTVNETKNYFIPLSKDKAEAAVRVVWEYQEATYLWKQYPKDISLRIEKAYQRKPEGKTIIKMDHQTYIVHFTKMIQEDPQTKEEISVRRLLS